MAIFDCIRFGYPSILNIFLKKKSKHARIKSNLQKKKMKKNYTINYVLVVLSIFTWSSLAAQQPEKALFKTYSGGSDKCYGRTMIMPTFDTLEEKVVIRPAYSYNKDVPPRYESETQRIKIIPEHIRIEVIPAEFESTTERIVIKNQESYIQTATKISPDDLFKSGLAKVEVKPAYKIWKKTKKKKNCRSKEPEDCLEWELVEVPAQRVAIDIKEADAISFPTKQRPSTIEPEQYVTVTTKVLKTPASYKEVTVPAQYQTVTKQILVEPRRVEQVQVPAEYKIVQRVINIKDGGFMEAREVVCRSEYPRYTRKIQEKLKALGYYEDDIDGDFGKNTRIALMKYQQENELPMGQYDYDTLKKLNLIQ